MPAPLHPGVRLAATVLNGSRGAAKVRVMKRAVPGSGLWPSGSTSVLGQMTLAFRHTDNVCSVFTVKY